MPANHGPWFKLEARFSHDPKIGALADRLDCDMVAAMGHMVSLWCWVMIASPDGDISDVSIRQLEEEARWRGDRGQFVRAAILSGLIDSDLEGRPVSVHGFGTRAKSYREARRKREARSRAQKHNKDKEILGVQPFAEKSSQERSSQQGVRSELPQKLNEIGKVVSPRTGAPDVRKPERRVDAELTACTDNSAPTSARAMKKPEVIQGDSIVAASADNPRTVRGHVPLEIESVFKKPKGQKVRHKSVNEGHQESADLVAARYVELHPKRRLGVRQGSKGWRLIVARLAEGFAADQLIAAVEGNHADEWHRAISKHEASYVFRNAEKVESFAAMREAQLKPKESPIARSAREQAAQPPPPLCAAHVPFPLEPPPEDPTQLGPKAIEARRQLGLEGWQ